MTIPKSLAVKTASALADSIEPRTMRALIRKIKPGYDLYERTGLPQSMVIPSRVAVDQIVQDLIDWDRYLEFIGLLLKVEQIGYMGRPVIIPQLKQIIKAIYDLGYKYNAEEELFMENPRVQKSPSWGCLRTGEEYHLAFLRLDIVGNSNIVKNCNPDLVNAAFSRTREITQNCVESRGGRLWLWEGDGGLAAFKFWDPNIKAVGAAIQLLNEMFLFNRTENPLENPIEIRIAVHSGPFIFSENSEEYKNQLTVKEVFDLEKNTRPDTVSISSAVRMMLYPTLAGMFSRDSNDKSDTSHYAIWWKK